MCLPRCQICASVAAGRATVGLSFQFDKFPRPQVCRNMSSLLIFLRNEYVLSLKTRLEKIETLLEMAGVLPEGTANEPLDEDGDDDGSQYDYWEPSHPRNGSLENASHLVPDSSEPSCPAIKDPAGGDLEGMSLFKMHESDDPRFLGRSSSSRFSREVVSNGLRIKPATLAFCASFRPILCMIVRGVRGDQMSFMISLHLRSTDLCLPDLKCFRLLATTFDQ